MEGIASVVTQSRVRRRVASAPAVLAVLEALRLPDSEMGAQMNELADAISWDGREVVLSLFALLPAGSSDEVPVFSANVEPAELRTYYLEDPEDRFEGRKCFEYDLIFETIPQNLESLVIAWLLGALKAGAEVAWFGFEGSFDFGHLLTGDIADQVYAVGNFRSLELALDDKARRGQRWIDVLTSVRAGLGAPTREE